MYSMRDLSSRGRNPDDVIVAKESAAVVVVVVEKEEEESADQNKGSHKDMSCTLYSNQALVEPKFGRAFLKKY